MRMQLAKEIREKYKEKDDALNEKAAGLEFYLSQLLCRCPEKRRERKGSFDICDGGRERMHAAGPSTKSFEGHALIPSEELQNAQ